MQAFEIDGVAEVVNVRVSLDRFFTAGVSKTRIKLIKCCMWDLMVRGFALYVHREL